MARNSRGFAGPCNRYGPHPYISGPIFASEYNGYPGDETDYGKATDTDFGLAKDKTVATHRSSIFAPGELTWLMGSHGVQPKL